MQKRTYVLIPGAWCGAWAWQRVASILRAGGHFASPVTLAGLGDRSRSSAERIDLTTHINDVTSHIEMEGLDDVTLVGWSYGGMVATGVAEAMPDRIRATVYLDAFVPEDGKALVDYLMPQARAVLQAHADKDEPLPPMPLERFGVSDPAVIDFLTPRLTSQPWRTFFQPLPIAGTSATISKTYIRCKGAKLPHFESTFTRMLQRSDFRSEVVDADHFCSISAPQLVAQILLS
jgi:pimeloyl-ACP methyl ester carboxylesterase